jgi:cyclomaltodextrinase / maltogenic alpha-amylase / neopullulanase
MEERMKKKIALTLFVLNTLFLYGTESEKKQLKGDGVIAVEKIKHGKENFFLNSENSIKINIYVAVNDIESAKIVYDIKGKKNVKEMEYMGVEGKSVLYSIDIESKENFFSYYFTLKDGSKKLYFGEKTSKKEKECKPFVIDRKLLQLGHIPLWVEEIKTAYEVVIDRFKNGDSENDPIINENCYKNMNPRNTVISGIRSSEIVEKAIKIAEAEEFKLNGWGSNWNKREIWEQKITENAKEYRRYGGDIKGVKDKLDYFKDIGIDTLLISPPFLSGSSYKDDVMEFNHIDPSFGTIIQSGEFIGENIKSTKGMSEYKIIAKENEKEVSFFTESDMIFIDFLKEAHKKGIRVIIEMPSAYISCSSYKFRDVLINGPDSVYADWFVLKDWKEKDKVEDIWNPYIVYEGKYSYGTIEKDGKKMRRKWIKPLINMSEEEIEEVIEWNKLNIDYLGIGSQIEIVKINFNNRDALNYYKKAVMKWIKGVNGKVEDKFEDSDGIDGIKFTSIEDIEGKDAFYNMIKEIKQLNKELYLTAEIGYENRKEFTKGIFEGVLNYGIGDNIYKLIANKNREKLKPTEFVEKVKSLYNGYPKSVIYNSFNILDSSNTDRAFSMTINTDREYDRLNGSDNDDYKSIRPDLYSENAVNLFKSMVIMQMMLPGVPIVYYGNENGMWGADDPENRKPMLWEDIKYERESDTLAKYKKESKKFGDKVEIDEANGRIFYENNINEEIVKFYKLILKFRKDNIEVLKNGEVNYIYADDTKGAIAVERKAGKKSFVAVINLTDKESMVKIPLEGGDYQSIFSDSKYSVVDKLMEVKLKSREGLILIRK